MLSEESFLISFFGQRFFLKFFDKSRQKSSIQKKGEIFYWEIWDAIRGRPIAVNKVIFRKSFYQRVVTVMYSSQVLWPKIWATRIEILDPSWNPWIHESMKWMMLVGLSDFRLQTSDPSLPFDCYSLLCFVFCCVECCRWWDDTSYSIERHTEEVSHIYCNCHQTEHYITETRV